MIDTGKYKGHTAAPWTGVTIDTMRQYPDSPTMILAQDAPLLLQEIKRLREQLRLAKEWVANEYTSCLSTMDIFTEYIGDD